MLHAVCCRVRFSGEQKLGNTELRKPLPNKDPRIGQKIRSLMPRVEKATSDRLSWEHSEGPDVKGRALAPEDLFLLRTQEARLSAGYAGRKGVLEV